MSKSISAADYKLRNAFDAIRRELLARGHLEYANRPLAYWALPADRRLPLALLGCSLRELLDRPFAEISATPGIGHKKLAMLVTLLQRVAETSSLSDESQGSSDVTESECADSPVVSEVQAKPAIDLVDANRVSETQWDNWRATIRAHQLESEVLGRICSSLQNLPTVIWRKTLADYLALSLSEIRALRTHGVKRVHAILSVFHDIDRAVGAVPKNSSLALRLVPRNLDTIETWLRDLFAHELFVSDAELRQNLLLPILNQIHIDGGEVVSGLAERRLAIEAPGLSVQIESRRLGVTRARVYQLLEVCTKIMEVRWPAGRWALHQLADHLSNVPKDGQCRTALTQLNALRDLCYPGSSRSDLTSSVDIIGAEAAALEVEVR